MSAVRFPGDRSAGRRFVIGRIHSGVPDLATNFAYRKRQLELEKKRKKEEKLKRKQERGSGLPEEDGEQELDPSQTPEAGQSEGGAEPDASNASDSDGAARPA